MISPLFEHEGIALTMVEWRQIYNIPRATMRYRLAAKWPRTRLFEPVDKSHRNYIHAHKLTWNGRTDTIRGWARELGFKRSTLQARYKYGWSVERMLTNPKQKWVHTKGMDESVNGESLKTFKARLQAIRERHRTK